MEIKNGVLTQDKDEYFKGRFFIVPKNVTKIDINAFFSSGNLSHISLPKTLTHIEEGAFYDCTKIKRIKLPKNLTYIGPEAFSYCSGLTKINIPSNVKSLLDLTFYGCHYLKNIDLHNSLTSIGNGCFRDCKSLKTINIPDSVSSIGHSAFEGCSELTKAKLPNNLTILPSNIFNNCYDLKSVILPNSLETIADLCFSNCKKLESITLPDSLKNINRMAFKKTSLKEITIPDSVEFLGDGVFYECHNLKNANLSNNITSLENNLFKYSGLESISLPKNLKTIGQNVFAETKLKEITLPDSVEKMGSDTFFNCVELKTVKLSNNLTEIPNKSFYNCRNLQEIHLPENLRTIGSYSFKNCTELQQVNIPNNLLAINSHSFSNCQKIDILTIPNSVTYIGEGAFENCSSLNSINLPENITEIPNALFYNCRSLQNIELPKNIQFISRNSFNGCEKLQEITIPDSTLSIGENAFKDCINLKKVTLSKNIKFIQQESFANCSKLKEISIPKGVAIIGKSAFENCYDIEKIEIPNTVKKIDESAFKNCQSLRRIFIPDSVKEFAGLGSIANKFIKYITKTENGYLFSDTPTENSIEISKIGTNLNLIGQLWEHKDTILSEEKNLFVKDFYNNFLNELNNSEISKSFINSHNFTFFKQFKKFDNGNFNYNTYKLLYNLGVFEQPVEIDGKKIDYAQKSANYLLTKLSKKETSIEELSSIAASMNVNGFNKEFLEFFIKDFDKLMEEEKKHSGFIAKCYNEFESVQKTNTNNRGSQRQLKPTAKKFIEYFAVDKFKGVTPETVHIANAISPYFSQQYTFDNAVKIFNEMKEKNIPTRILKNKLIDESSPFKSIEKLAEGIKENHTQALGYVSDVATKQFSFEWLEKNDPTNFYLGKLCSCCAHLEGMGYSIMRASIIHPNVQNLVIRNKKGEIIAKSTLFVNPKEGYGVFNNVEIASTYSDLKSSHEEIYETYIDAVNKFVEQYNIENPNHPLKQINVGMGNNDLSEKLYRHHQSSKKILKAVYTEMGENKHDGYEGDSSKEQLILWDSEINKKLKNNQNETTQNYERIL